MPDSGERRTAGDRRVTATRDDLDRSISALKSELTTLINGRHELYNERHRAEGEKAINLAEALKEYKKDANEWRSTLSDFRNSVPTLRDFQAMQEKIAELREHQSAEVGKDSGIEHSKKTQQWVIGVGVTLLLFIAAQIILVWSRSP